MKENLYPIREVRIRLEEGRTLYSPEKISTPEAAVKVMQEELSRYDREVVLVVNLNIKGQPINFNMVSMGTLNASLVVIANVLKSCILSNAGSFILLHNHPSGDLTPSPEDLELTRRLILAGHLVGIDLLDHIIIAGNRKETYSMREHSDLDFSTAYGEQQFKALGMVKENAQPMEAMDTPFGPFIPADNVSLPEGDPSRKEEVALHFGKGFCQFFTSKKGDEMARIRIPNTSYETWPSFVVPARIVHDNRYGKGLWLKLPANGKTMLTISKRTRQKDGSEKWESKSLEVSNRELKEMVESYKDKGPKGNTPEEEELLKPKMKSR